MQINFHRTAEIVRANSVVVPEHMKHRLSTGIQFFDEALGSKEKPGFVAGSVFLLAGDPGSGKSTLSRQVCSMTELDSLMNLGEESFEQVKMCLEERKFEGDFDLSNYRNVDELLEVAEKHKYQMIFIDSLQNLYSELDHSGSQLKAAPGSNKQTEICAEKIYAYAKRTLTTVFLLCHSTKGGDFKGAQTLEHIIDATIMIQVDEDSAERTLILQKNRWGMTNIPFSLTMTEHGLSVCEFEAQEEREGKEEKVASKGSSTRAIARSLYAKMVGCTKQEYIDALQDEADISPITAGVYYYSLRRTRVDV